MSAWAAASAEIDSEAGTGVVANLAGVQARVAAIAPTATLIAVSKTKPLSSIAAAFSAGHRDFGENYVQELVDKAASVAESNLEIRWHFIGRLQSNKAKLLCTTPNLHAVHTVHNEKIAAALQKHWLDVRGPEASPLRVFIQVNTSGEEQKGGCEPAEAPALATVVRDAPNLDLVGLMCIGKYSGAEGDASPDFRVLRERRAAVAEELGVDQDNLALSMGMSHDFETALEHGATHVRVGSTIFGARVYSQE
ncbi:hypothetical protein CTAYLR_001301 [Chrysophaeum taylorii]|uniref:Pyridoxal phosphate homeostasis protein n=1 Tax=Chrysophaeum taylorii TaxID=2483200 RepID=A0AAD7XK70_9STRA|nr:hypothetical protein CTAYLR_001301 [Chrysophaeum taylorii]